MTNDECQVGAKVICIYRPMEGDLGTITEVHRDPSAGHVVIYVVKNNNSTHSIQWSKLDSWNLYQPPANRAKLAANQARSLECPCGIMRSACTYHS